LEDTALEQKLAKEGVVLKNPESRNRFLLNFNGILNQAESIVW
jgi:hypothetical protein